MKTQTANPTENLVNPQEGNPNAKFRIVQIEYATGEISTQPNEVDWNDWIWFANGTVYNAIECGLIATATGTLLLVSQPSGEKLFGYDVVIGSGWVSGLAVANQEEEGSKPNWIEFDTSTDNPQPSSWFDATDVIAGELQFSGENPNFDKFTNRVLMGLEGCGWNIIGFGGGDHNEGLSYVEYAFWLPNRDIVEIVIQEEEGGLFSLIGTANQEGNAYATLEGLRVAEPSTAIMIFHAMANRPQEEEGNQEEEEEGSGWDFDLELEPLEFDDSDLDLDLDFDFLELYD